MKICYNTKSDYLEVFFSEKFSSYYEASELSNDFLTVFCSDDSDEIIGYGVDDAFLNISRLNKFSHKQKLTLYSWMIREKVRAFVRGVG